VNYSFAPIFEAKNSRQFAAVFRDLVDENDEKSVRMVKRIESQVTKMVGDKKDADLLDVFSAKCDDKDLKVVFELFDMDRDGFLNQDEIRNVLSALGESDFELPKKTKKLSFEEFKKLINN